jgi:hypothetical protein
MEKPVRQRFKPYGSDEDIPSFLVNWTTSSMDDFETSSIMA